MVVLDVASSHEFDGLRFVWVIDIHDFEGMLAFATMSLSVRSASVESIVSLSKSISSCILDNCPRAITSA